MTPGSLWQDLLPPGRRFAALPSRHRPVIVAECAPPVQAYVRNALLTAPPGSRLPGWLYGMSAHALRVRPLWWLLPQLTPSAPSSAVTPLASLVAAGGPVLVLRHSHDPDPGCVLLFFATDGASPSTAVKVAGGERTAAAVLREARNLELVREVVGRDVRGTVPEVLDVVDHHGHPALVMTAMRGVPMFVRYYRRGHTLDRASVRRDLAAAGEWLRRVQEATGPDMPLDLVPETVERLSAQLSAQAGAPRVLDRIGALRRRLSRHRARTTLVHGDFWPGNLLVERGEITGVVDWEHAAIVGSPVRDLARFALSYSRYLDRHTRPGRSVPGHPQLVADGRWAAARYGIDGAGWYPDLVRAFLAEGLSRLGLPASCGRDAVLAEVAALAAEASAPDFAREQLNLFLSMVEEAE